MNRQFGALSGLAMVLIVLNHSIELGMLFPSQWGFPAVAEWEHVVLFGLKAFGWFAVPIFLYTSGCFVSYAAQGEPPRLSSKFLFSTFRHIIIPYIIWSIVFYVLIYLEYRETYTPLGYIKNLLVGYPYHFVPLLVFYYLLSPLLVRISRTHGILLIVLIGVYQLLLINIIYPGTLYFVFPVWSRYLAPPILRTTLADWGIFFPLGLVNGMRTKFISPLSKKLVWLIVVITAMLFGLGVLDLLEIIRLPLAHFLATFFLVLLFPAIKRDMIPFARQLERIGRRSYGIYLMNLIVLNLALIGIRLLTPAVFLVHIILFPLLFFVTLTVSLLFMEAAAKGPFKPVYRYVFG
jgi:peptidoglycan/LPS O-acetylase OafA/YrhL